MSVLRETRRLRVRHGRGVQTLNTLFLFEPKTPPKPKRKHAKHDARWKRRKIVNASRNANR